MNLRHAMVCLFGLSIAACQSVRADDEPSASAATTTAATTSSETAPSGVETWDGHGAVFDGEGALQGEYDVTLQKRRREGGLDMTVDVALPDGRTMHFTQAVNGAGERFEIVSEAGNGGGYSLGEGMLVTYVGEANNGKAQTIFEDGDEMRIVRTELEGGEAVRFYREVYSRR